MFITKISCHILRFDGINASCIPELAENIIKSVTDTSENPHELRETVSDLLAKGDSKEKIYKKLLTDGVSLDAIEDAFDSLQDERGKEDTQRKTVQVVVTIAAILVGAGIFSFIASNWQEMERGVKVSVIVISMFIFYLTGWHIKEKLGYTKTGEALILLGSLTYGGGIFLVAQMFNVRANWPDGFILWTMGSIAMAVVTNIFLLYYLAIISGIVAVIGYPVLILSLSFGFSMSNPFSLTSTILLIFVTVVTFIVGLRLRKGGSN